MWCVKHNWRASEVSETLSGVMQSRFRCIYLFIFIWYARTSFSARASNYILVKRFQKFYSLTALM